MYTTQTLSLGLGALALARKERGGTGAAPVPKPGQNIQYCTGTGILYRYGTVLYCAYMLETQFRVHRITRNTVFLSGIEKHLETQVKNTYLLTHLLTYYIRSK